MIRAHIIVKGKVHGVGFRAAAQRMALQLGLSGWVRNLPNGLVEAIAEGGELEVEEFIDWCRSGPPSAFVEGVDVERTTARGDLRGFSRN